MVMLRHSNLLIQVRKNCGLNIEKVKKELEVQHVCDQKSKSNTCMDVILFKNKLMDFTAANFSHWQLHIVVKGNAAIMQSGLETWP